MKKVQEFLANHPLGSIVKIVLGFLGVYLLGLVEFNGTVPVLHWDKIELATLGKIVGGAIVVMGYNWLNPADTRYGKKE